MHCPIREPQSLVMCLQKNEDHLNIIIVKIIRNQTLKIVNVIALKWKKLFFFCPVICPKDADGIANSEDPDQTASLGAV